MKIIKIPAISEISAIKTVKKEIKVEIQQKGKNTAK